MTPPKRFWPFDDDEDVEIYDNPFWDLPGRTRRGTGLPACPPCYGTSAAWIGPTQSSFAML